MSKHQEAYLGIERFIEMCIGDLYDYDELGRKHCSNCGQALDGVEHD